MNVLMIGPDRVRVKGGMSTVINNYYNSDIKDKANIRFISSVVDGKKIFKAFTFIKSYLLTIYYLMFSNINIVHIHTASRNSFIRKSYYIRLARLFRKKIIIHMHGGEFDKYYWNESNEKKRNKIRKILNYSDVIIALGEKWKKSISEYCDTKIVVINNAIKTNDKNNYSLESNKIVFLGRLEEAKGVFDLIEAAKKICKQNNEVEFILAGNKNEDKIKSIISYNNLTERIKLTGWIGSEEIDKLLKETMIFILPSYNEGMPMSILEAMSYGIPIISTNVGGIPELVKSENGILINPGDIEELEKAIEVLIKDEKMRLEISKSNYNIIINRYSQEKHNKSLLNLYESFFK